MSDKNSGQRNTLKENIIKKYEQNNNMALITFLTHQVTGASLGITHCIVGPYKVVLPSHPIKLQYIWCWSLLSVEQSSHI